MTLCYRRLRRLAVLFTACLLALMPLLTPSMVRADELLVGGAAVIADANGDPVRLRDAASTNADILAEYDEGTVLDVLGGPVSGDGLSWYRVAIDGQTGYMAADYLVEYTGDGAGGSGDAGVILSEVNLRSGASTADDIVAVLQEGDDVLLTGSVDNGFYPVSGDAGSGWVYGAYLAVTGASYGDSANTNDALNLRDSPNASSDILTVIPGGAAVTITGAADGSFLPVTYNGMAGWVAAVYLTSGGEPAITIDDVNFRTGASLDSEVIRVVNPETTVLVTGSEVDGFYPVAFDGATGWISAEFLSIGGETPVTPVEPQPEPEPVSYAIQWPVSGGTWEISQGYNGSSHYSSGLWAYYYSIDIVNTSGVTAGQTVYSPVNGTVKWTEDATGGIAIDMGDGHAVSIFHITLEENFQPGDQLTQGQVLGYISGPGENGNMGFDHLHLSLWESTDGGNWSRVAVPFTGVYSIAGQDFPDIGGTYQWTRTVITP